MAGANCLSDYLPIVVNLEQVEGAGLCANPHIRWQSHKRTKGCSRDHPITMSVRRDHGQYKAMLTARS